MDQLSRDLYATNAHELKGNNCCTLLLGPKGAGKTSLLQAITIACYVLFPNIIPIFVNYKREQKWKSVPGSHLPESLLFNAFSIHGLALQRSNFTDLVAQFTSFDKHAVIFADEFHSLYLWDDGTAVDQFFGIGNKSTHKLIRIGSGTDGIIWSIISGSAAVTRDLCFCLLSQEKEKEYPGYKKLSLNDSRYKPVALQTISKKQAFRNLVEFALNVDTNFFSKTEESKRISKSALEEDTELELLYLASRGVFRGLNNALTDPSLAIKKQLSEILVTIMKNPIAEKLFNELIARWKGDIWDLPFVTSAELKSYFPNGNPLDELYRLCDSSYFQAVHDNYSTSFYPGHPLIQNKFNEQELI